METLHRGAVAPSAAAGTARGAVGRAALPAWARSAALKAVAGAGFCAFLAALFASQIYLGMLSHGHQWWRLFAWQAGAWALWGLLAPGVVRLGRVLPLDRGRWIPHAAAHAALSVAVAALHVVPLTWITQWIDPYQPVQSGLGFGEQYVELVYSWFPLDVLFYWGILGAGYAWRYYHRLQEREVRASQLEARLARAELQALKLQLHPHFLFNALNAVAGEVRRGESRAAVGMLTGLSELLRYVLESAERQLVPLAEELEFARRYLDIQKARFPDRLRAEVEAAPEMLAVPVPNLILQPLVENALEHGLARREGPGRVRIGARCEGGELVLEIEDDGPGPGAASAGSGIGLDNTRARLGELYGEAASFELRDGPRGGAVAEVRIPVGEAG